MDAREKLAWAAGLFEGEGSCYKTDGNGYRLEICMTDEDVIRKFYEVVQVGQLYGPLNYGDKHYKPKWRWTVNKAEDVIDLCNKFLPFMLSRRRQKLQIALEACHKVKPRRKVQGQFLEDMLEFRKNGGSISKLKQVFGVSSTTYYRHVKPLESL